MNYSIEFLFDLKSLLNSYLEKPDDSLYEAVLRTIDDYKQRKDRSIKKPKRKKKYETEEERIAAYKTQQNNYAKKKWKCDDCDVEIYLGNKSKHLLSKKHLKNSAGARHCPTCSDTDSESTNDLYNDNRDCPTCSDSEHYKIFIDSKTNLKKSKSV